MVLSQEVANTTEVEVLSLREYGQEESLRYSFQLVILTLTYIFLREKTKTKKTCQPCI